MVEWFAVRDPKEAKKAGSFRDDLHNMEHLEGKEFKDLPTGISITTGESRCIDQRRKSVEGCSMWRKNYILMLAYACRL
ncbi:hypothetical protein HU200_035171 [Digitaria exilis]|uniref:Uncharacterized protein n=1 Tax=Digitaria exilis TaxID=1010633 RepID=A0A835ELY5_9POAL|nr:hypothetical protein HU200_035171 [Digitaria exilis]